MKSGKLLCVLLCVIITSCVHRFGRPEVPRCIGLDNGKLFCVYKDQEYEVTPTNYICTDIDSYNTLETFYDGIEFRLATCLRNPAKCQ